MPSPAASSSPTLSPKSSPKSLNRMAPIAEEPQVDAQSAAQSNGNGSGAASSGNEDGYDSASSTNSGSASSGGRRSRNPGLTIDTVTASAANTSASTAASTATAQSPTSPASSSGTTSPTSATSPTSGNGPMTPTTPLSDEVDFSLVYALHTFVATMEGQVAVVRNEPLILLDDSNSYWWLVKPLRSNTIGYIPAEIIETPYERLARVNQQKNVERALFRSNDIPGAPSKSTRPSLHPKTVVFPSDPRGDIFEYSPAVSDMSSGDEDEEDWDPENTKNPTEVAVVAGSQDEDTIMDDAVEQEQAVVQAQEDDAMEVDAPATATITHEDADEEDELKPNPRRTSLGAGLLLRNRDQWSGDEDELPSDAADVEPQRAPSPEPSPTKATASSSPPTSPVKSSSRPAISTPTRSVASIPLDDTDANAANDADDDEDTSAPATTTTTTPAPQPTRSASASEIDPITVLRIFPGTCAIPAESHQFKTVVVTKTMSVKELLHQALLKYRVFGPLASQHQGSNLDAMMADWYLTLSFTGAPTAGHHHVMNPDENVLGALEAVQKQAEEEAAAVAAAQQQAEAAAAAAVAPKRKSVLARFASKLYTPTLLASTKPSKHHLPKPILHVISPQDSGSIRLMLHQYSAMSMSPTRAASKPAPTPLAATENSFNTSSSSSMSLVPGAFPAGPASPPTSLSRNLSTGVSTLVRIELDHPTPAAPMSDSALPPVRMAKTLKVDRVAPAAAVMEAALRKFSLAEGRNVGATPEYELVELASGTVCPASDPLPLPKDTMATFIMRKVVGARGLRTTLTLAVSSPEKERPQSQVELRIPSPPSPKDQQQEVARADSGVEGEEVSPGGTKRFSELLQEAQSLDLMQGLFNEEGKEVEVPSRDNAVEAK